MSQKGLHLRKQSESLNETNIRRGSYANVTVNGIADDFQKLTLDHRNEQLPEKHARLNNLSTSGNEFATKKSDVRLGNRLLDKFLSSIGLRRIPQPDNENLTQEDAVANTDDNSIFLGKESEKRKAIIDYHNMGIFWNVDLESSHADFLVDIVRYAFSAQAFYPSTTKTDWNALGGYRIFTLTNLFIIEIFYNQLLPTEVLPLAAYLVAVTISKYEISRNQLEDLSIAAVRLAAKVESQYTLGKEIVAEFDIRKLNAWERKICRATDFRLLRCSSLFFMRIVQKLVERHSWQWKFAKFASQLACCQIELASLKPSLLAGVVMRLTCFLADEDSWPPECYKILGEDPLDYDFPQSILCRLILTARVNNDFADVYSRYHSVVDHAISIRPGWIEGESAAANEVEMLGNKVFNR
ncbi:cyclin protein [Dictyocaulus viviparus]|uniref:Cyclin protein n=1 Tax=Dictyocaulus viviparus TaxID=29172 RepID=A0A0D8XL48_DICVI|nr:cyclin protein [Dictyocaulus viviparus]